LGDVNKDGSSVAISVILMHQSFLVIK